MSTLREMTLQAGALIALTALLRALWLEKLPKRAFTALWLVAAARMVLPLSLTVPAPAAPVSAVYQAVAQTVPAVRTGVPFPWAKALWLAGAAVCAVFFLGGHVLCLRRYREALPLDDPAVDRFCRQFMPRRQVSVRLCQRISTPLTFGLFRPVILLPAGLDTGDRRQLSFILAHELTHIRRLHIPFKYLLTAAVCLHWFNPLAWVMYILAGRDVELVCDEAVLRQTRRGRADYALTLLALEERRTMDPLLSGFGAKAVRERIEQIMRFRPSGAVSLAVAAALVLSSVTVFASAAESAPLSPPRISEGFVIPTPTPVAYVTVVHARPTEEPMDNYVNSTPVPINTPPTDAPAAPLYEVPIMARPTPEQPAAADPAPDEPRPTPESTPAPMEAGPMSTPEPTDVPAAVPTPGEATASPAPWAAEVLPTPVTGGPDPMTPIPPATPAPALATPVPLPADLPETAGRNDLPA